MTRAARSQDNFDFFERAVAFLRTASDDELAACVATAAALVPPMPQTKAPRTVVYENFGFDFAESQAANTDAVMLGERRLKTEFINLTTSANAPSQKAVIAAAYDATAYHVAGMSTR